MTTVLVTGATGFLGEHVMRQLLGSGNDISAFVRPGSQTGWLQQQGVKLRVGDLADRVALERALSGRSERRRVGNTCRFRWPP